MTAIKAVAAAADTLYPHVLAKRESNRHSRFLSDVRSFGILCTIARFPGLPDRKLFIDVGSFYVLRLSYCGYSDRTDTGSIPYYYAPLLWWAIRGIKTLNNPDPTFPD